jgi:MoaA/NifB/PqqE/SkfB family radical SAM enzyme
MESSLDLTEYLNKGAEKLIADILRATLRNPKETVFLRKYHRQQAVMEKRRSVQEAQGHPVPMFLISSITSACNLACKGCYARANGLCGENSKEKLLTAEQWDGIFSQAEEAGISFVLLAGGEPLLRTDVLQKAADHEGILFPIFTNGTMLDKGVLRLLDNHRNLVPVISLEGGQEATDARRGEGTFTLTQSALSELLDKKLLFGVSLTVTAENMVEVTSPGFLRSLYDKGCRLAFFIEYVPVAPGTEHLALCDEERELLDSAQDSLRERFPGMIFLSFPGDEKRMGGCLAAGRGFFHINPYGGAEPCPFSPYSDISLKEHTLMQALESPFFKKVRELNAQETEHRGGCALFAKEAQVKSLLFPAGL